MASTLQSLKFDTKSYNDNIDIIFIAIGYKWQATPYRKLVVDKNGA